MFQRDPVAIVLGQDVAELIYRIIHREALKEVNAEYHMLEKLVLFNWRNLQRESSSSRQNYSFRGKRLNFVIATLPKNY